MPYPAGYDFPLPFGCWPSLLKPSLPLDGYVPPLPLADWFSPDRRGVITFRFFQDTTDGGALFIAVDLLVFQN